MACEGSTTDALSEFQIIELAIYKLYKFEDREQRILEFLLQATFARGKASVHIPKEDYFNRGAKINSRGNTNVILRRLIESFLVIEENPPDYFGFRLPVDNWKAPVKQTITDAVLHELLGLDYNRDDLQGAMRETFLEGQQNLPPRSAPPGPVRLIRSIPSEDAQSGQTGGVTSRESAGSRGHKPEMPAAGKDCPSPVISASVTNPSQNPVRFRQPEPVAPMPSVPTSGTGHGSRGGNQEAKPQPALVSPVVPAVGTAAVPRARAVQRSTVNEPPNVQRLRQPLKKEEERRLMARIEAFFRGDFPNDPERHERGKSEAFPEEMKQSGIFWRTRVVRNFPAAVEEALGQALIAYRNFGAAAFDHKPKWLNGHVKLYAGIKSWADVPPGPKPI
jgi:hypothetical protein